MVRHECAEALGAIATPECQKLLEEYAKDQEVRQSPWVIGHILRFEGYILLTLESSPRELRSGAGHDRVREQRPIPVRDCQELIGLPYTRCYYRLIVTVGNKISQMIGQ